MSRTSLGTEPHFHFGKSICSRAKVLGASGNYESCHFRAGGRLQLDPFDAQSSIMFVDDARLFAGTGDGDWNVLEERVAVGAQ